MLAVADTISELLTELGLDSSYATKSLELLEKGESKYLRDLKLNVKSVLNTEHLTEKETRLLALAIASNDENAVLQEAFSKQCEEYEASASEIAEAVACASLLANNNVLYRFRHFTQKEKYAQLPGRLRMNIMMKPVTGKAFFELMSLAISAVNGCEMCVNAHEQSLLELGSSEERVFDAIRLASVITSLSKVIY
ncbi:carboxymuconolactone decarboxylase family protein [Fulvivirgaceae bacterium BMA10]|uniref:Alkyl hydroperoxide reductase AhpD n=1 Tax=Splendidivirga corallicola TaxID=3051826 RepID=A0ABT8KW75_9BACT|nr:carboxymuconolactone decarboxylase family protein [Fulvivirgaceae bacterium BMA10]